NSNLSGKSLCRGHAYFWTGMSICSGMSFPGNRRTHYITYTEYCSPFLFSQLYSCQCICRLTGLADCNHHILFTDHRISLPEFRSIFYLYRNTGEIFKHILSYQARMPGSTTANNDDTVRINKLFMVVKNPTHPNHSLIG